MKEQMFTGIGCFAKPDRLERIFNRLVRNYSLGPFKGIQLLNAHLSNKNDGAHLLQALMAGLVEADGSGSHKTICLKYPRKIAGFYLTLNGQKLNLSIFARGSSSRPEIFRTDLDELTKLRQKRMN